MLISYIRHLLLKVAVEIVESDDLQHHLLQGHHFQ